MCINSVDWCVLLYMKSTTNFYNFAFTIVYMYMYILTSVCCPMIAVVLVRLLPQFYGVLWKLYSWTQIPLCCSSFLNKFCLHVLGVWILTSKVFGAIGFTSWVATHSWHTVLEYETPASTSEQCTCKCPSNISTRTPVTSQCSSPLHSTKMRHELWAFTSQVVAWHVWAKIFAFHLSKKNMPATIRL